eukprot:UN09298
MLYPGLKAFKVYYGNWYVHSQAVHYLTPYFSRRVIPVNIQQYKQLLLE